MAAFSRWQNDRLYQFCDEIGEDERQRDRGLFFGSIHHTLDHICMVNRSILAFLNKEPWEGESPKQIVWPDWNDLKATRLTQDDILSAGGRDWSQDWLAKVIAVKGLKVDTPPTCPRWVMVVQIFQHQTHHRSQVTTALHAMGIDYGGTDIPFRPGAGYFAG